MGKVRLGKIRLGLVLMELFTFVTKSLGQRKGKERFDIKNEKKIIEVFRIFEKRA